MLRRLIRMACGLSLLLACLIAALWLASYWRTLGVSWAAGDYRLEPRSGGTYYRLRAEDGAGLFHSRRRVFNHWGGPGETKIARMPTGMESVAFERSRHDFPSRWELAGNLVHRSFANDVDRIDPEVTVHTIEANAPLWPAVVGLLVLPALYLLIGRMRTHAVPVTCCGYCGYETQSPAGKCPECGTEFESR
jgi:hypothetical protein